MKEECENEDTLLSKIFRSSKQKKIKGKENEFETSLMHGILIHFCLKSIVHYQITNKTTSR